VAEEGPHGVVADFDAIGNFFVTKALGMQVEDFGFPLGKAVASRQRRRLFLECL
jgi:hypothetical protein